MAHQMPQNRKVSRIPAETAVRGIRAPRPWRISVRWALFALLAVVSSSAAPSGNSERVSYPDSIREIPAATDGAAAGQRRARIMRATLDQSETVAMIDFEVALHMRNFAELRARVARGEIIPRAEMEAKYFPLRADYERMVVWLAAQGLTVTRADSTRLSIFVRGTVRQIAEILRVSFARVANDEGEFTSAITAPSVPTALAPALIGINGLQPHLRAHKLTQGPAVHKASLTSNAPPYTPAQILKAYNANTTGLTGAGQTIAIVIDTFPIDTDLSAFWSQCGISRSSSIEKIQVPNTPAPPSPSDPGYDGAEAAIDAELTSSIAPAAKIRIYSTGTLSFTYLTRAYQQVYDDAPSQLGLHQVNLSYGIGEGLPPNSQLQSDAQHFAALASAGIAVIASTGDGGSNPDPNTGGYSASATLQPSHPASDPNVTGVGATTLTLDLSSGTTSSETAWSLSQTSKGLAASGGGISNVFSRPSWQTGTGVPAGTMRLVPDVAVLGDPQTGCYIVYLGSGSTVWGGTSVSAPVWSGFCALFNQARDNAGRSALGLLGPSIYPLIGTTSFRDITSGNNGAYTAGAGYDLVTGVGTPNVAALAQALGAQSYAPVITAQPATQSVTIGQNAMFTVAVNGNPPPTFRWQRQPVGSTTWSNLSDTTTYTGTATTTLTVNSATEAMSGDSFQCVVSNASGTVTTSPPAFLVVAHPFVFTSLAGQSGSSGSVDGTGSAARFFDPADLAADNAGNIYVADTNNNTIRKITPAGAVTTLAGLAGTSGSADGTGSAARFYHPMGIAVDGAGNIYVADTANATIRKITATGVVTTVAGQAGVSGHVDGNATTARFDQPSDVAVDASGNLYVADVGSSTIRKITPAGVVSTLAGLAYSTGSADGTGSAARFYSPEGLVVDASGNLYVADTNNSTIRKITPAGVVSTLAGLAGSTGDADGPGSTARFYHPSDLALDSAGNIFVADTDNSMIRRIDSGGIVSYVAGGQVVIAVVGMVSFNYPTGVAVDASGDVYVADTNNHIIQKGLPAAAPLILTQPQSQSVTVGANVQFSVTASGVPAPSYQWNKGGTAISGANGSTLALNNVQSTDAGTYAVTVSNLFGSTTSNPASLTVNTPTPSPNASSGGGGGGGAMQVWFVLALALGEIARRSVRRR